MKKFPSYQEILKTVMILAAVSLVCLNINQPVLAEDNTNIFSSLLNNFLSIFGGNKPTPTPAATKQKNQLLQESVKKLLDKQTPITPTPNKSLIPSGTAEKIIDYNKYPDTMKAFLPNTNLLEESKKYATSPAGFQFINTYVAQINTSNPDEKFVHVKPGYCTLRLFIPETPTGKVDKSVAQKSYQEIKMLDCRSKRD